MRKIFVDKQNNNDDSYIIDDIIENKSFVKNDELIFTVETSKSVIEIFSDYEGYITLNPNIKNGDSVLVGQLIAIISDEKNLSYDFNDKVKSNEKQKNPGNFTKSAFKYALENNISISDYSIDEIVTLDMLKSKNGYFDVDLTKPKIIIVGACGQGLEILSIIKQQSVFEFSGFVDLKYPKEKKYHEFDIIGDDDSYKKIYDQGIHNVVIAGVWLKDPKIISNIFEKCSSIGFNFPNIIHESAIISDKVNLGCGIQIFSNVFIGPNVNIGDGTVINNGSIVSHDSNVGKFSFIAPGAIIAGNVNIGNYVILGINSSVYLRKSVPDHYILENNQSYL